jgi:hypothetical protein
VFHTCMVVMRKSLFVHNSVPDTKISSLSTSINLCKDTCFVISVCELVGAWIHNIFSNASKLTLFHISSGVHKS